MPLNNFTSAVPVIATADVAATIHYFEQTLGFKQQWSGETLRSMLVSAPAGPSSTSLTILILLPPFRTVASLPTFFSGSPISKASTRNMRATNAQITEALSERPWGVRQYVIREPNGYLLKVAESVEETSK